MKRPGKRQLEWMKQIELLRPRTADELHRFVEVVLRLRVPRRAMMTGNDAPFDYLVHSFFEGGVCSSHRTGETGDAGDDVAKPQAAEDGGGDVIVWANRGGGKTMLGAAATLLDMLFKPGVQVRILSGSLYQAGRMFDYLRRMFATPLLRGLVRTTPTQRRIELINGSVTEVLTQSERSVRGQHVHKLRCDEVETFKPYIWRAAQLVPKSGACGGVDVRGTLDALSTMHKRGGLMSHLIDDARADAHGPRVLRWCALDVIERCPPQRDCEACVLWRDCQGAAKQADGFMKVDDLVNLWQRTDDDTWAAEMMCRRPSTSGCVYARFDPTPGGAHVRSTVPGGGDRVLVASLRAFAQPIPGEGKPAGVLRKAGSRLPEPEPLIMVGGVDFGMRSPFIFLLARIVPPPRRDQTGPEHFRVEVVDEYIAEGLTLDQNMACVEQRDWPRPTWLGVDPAGGQRSSHTGKSDIQLLRQRGYKVLAKRIGLFEGINRVRRRLDRRTLVIDPICTSLIEAMSKYHFNEQNANDQYPVKDGADHACDALRYLIVNLELTWAQVETTRY